MIRRRKQRLDRPEVRRRVDGTEGVIVGLHGYGGDEHQLDSLLPLRLPATFVWPRAPHRVDPGWGWWEPESDELDGLLELAPAAGVDAAVKAVVGTIRDAQASEGLGPNRTVLVGYSQGATLALSVAARHPELISAVAVGAGFLLPEEIVARRPVPLDVLVMNGSLDPIISADDHHQTLARFAAAGHRVAGRIDGVPHVIDSSQVAVVETMVAQRLGVTAVTSPADI
ncbi:MAG: dienelactone hydrolase family protein [Actinomycetota bacterium]